MAHFRVHLRGVEKVARMVPRTDDVVGAVQEEVAAWLRSDGVRIAQGATPVDTGRLRRGWRVGRPRVTQGAARGRFGTLGIRGRSGRFQAIAGQSLTNPTPYARFVFDPASRRARSPREQYNLRNWLTAEKLIERGSEIVAQGAGERAMRRHARRL